MFTFRENASFDRKYLFENEVFVLSSLLNYFIDFSLRPTGWNPLTPSTISKEDQEERIKPLLHIQGTSALNL